MLNSIIEAYLGMYDILLESIHPDLQSILDNSTGKAVNSDFVQKMRELIDNNKDTGLSSDVPKKGSSRAVYFPSDAKDITLDGHPTKIKSAVKIAYSGAMDRFHKEPTMMGEDQNKVESNPDINNEYGVFRNKGNNNFEYDENGVLAPVLATHPSHSHIEVAKLHRMTESKLAELTKTPEFPNGLSSHHIRNALVNRWHEAHGNSENNSESHIIFSHPFVSRLHHLILNTDLLPDDIHPSNMGVFTFRHPATGEEISRPVIADWGMDRNVAKKYEKAQLNQTKVTVRKK